jgi:glycine/D-amino acid oxidase-like deaminating enzyme
LPVRTRNPRIVVIGAGAFGGWTALELTRRGAEVSLVDAWGPGNARASSGGETRIIRATYGTRAVYTRMALRALDLWRAHEERSKRRFFHKTGVLWMFGDDDSFAHASASVLRAEGATFDQLTLEEASRRFPEVAFDGIASAFLEPEAGYLLARQACEDVAGRVHSEGGEYRLSAVAGPVSVEGAPITTLTLLDGTRIEADVFIFACGPWLASLFPDVVGKSIVATRQDVYYFGLPAGDARFTDARMPVWIDFRDRQIYGIPSIGSSGFKVADDASGPEIDPTTVDRDVSDAGVAAARAFLALRFPGLAGAPLVGSEVCQYESTPDANFIIDRHPGAANVWIVGGGSGHGFKMGPAVGELVAALALGESEPDPAFGLARLAAPPPGGWQVKWS